VTPEALDKARLPLCDDMPVVSLGTGIYFAVINVASPAKPIVVNFGPYEFSPYSGELRKEGMRVRLEGQPLAILQVLLERPGELIRREELRKKLWSEDTFVDFEHSLNAAVKRLRAALNDSADQPHYIETLARRGYRFIAPVNPAGAEIGVAASSVTPNLPVTRTPSALHDPRLWLLAAAVCVVAIVAWGWHQWRHRTAAPAAPVIRSLAVLPLENLSGDPAQEYLADGMTEELIGRLSGIHDLRVVSRTSVMQFKDTRMSAPEIAKALHVEALVEGSVIREGNRFRVHAQLIRGATDEHFWSETYDCDVGDVLALQSDVAQSIAAKVEVTVTGEERARLAAARTVSHGVYENYLMGLVELRKGRTRTHNEKSIAYFGEAISKDPTFAPAFVGLAAAYDGLAGTFVGAPPNEVRPKVIGAARKTLELDPDLAEAHALLADMDMQQWQWEEAQAEYKRALELKPNDAAAHIGLARWLLCQGRTEEGLAWSRRARELDPLAISGAEIGWILYLARRYDDSIQELRSKLAGRPDDVGALWLLGFALIAKNQPEEAIPVLEKAASVSHRSPGSLEILATAYARAGHRSEALRLLDELRRRRETSYVPSSAFFTPYLALGENDQAFEWLERAYQEKSNLMMYLRAEPIFDPIRGDPRFADLVHRVGLDKSH
jgi:TolB-like protein/DNA-binding winged helix-turn-helix (wHTH) protein/tetratricopeptide (TPR) repeat protein